MPMSVIQKQLKLGLVWKKVLSLHVFIFGACMEDSAFLTHFVQAASPAWLWCSHSNSMGNGEWGG